MDKKPLPTTDPDLTPLRAAIDAIDDRLIALLIERSGLVKNVGALKNQVKPGHCHIRAGREADMVRRIITKFSGTDFSPAAAAAIWRVMIGTYTTLESNLAISVFTPERDDALFWMAREYFGPAVPITRQPQIKRVIGDVMDGKAAVGIVPFLRSSDMAPWWTNLIQQGQDMPKVFAHIPFVYHDTPGKDAPSAFAIARITPEETDSDLSLLVLEAEHNVSQNKLQTAFVQGGLEATWLGIASLTPTVRHHLVSVKGFITSENESIKSIAATLGPSLFNLSYLGAYATPIVLHAASTQEISIYATK